MFFHPSKEKVLIPWKRNKHDNKDGQVKERQLPQLMEVNQVTSLPQKVAGDADDVVDADNLQEHHVEAAGPFNEESDG